MYGIRKSLIIFLLWMWVINGSLLYADQEPLNLKSLIEEALQNNPEIIALKNKYEAFRAKVPQAFSLPDPWLGIEYEEVPKGKLDLADAPMRNYSVEQMIPFPTKLFTRANAASKEAKSAYEKYKEKEKEIIQKVKTAYLELFLIYISIDITNENKTLLEQLAATAAARFSVGKASQQDALKAQVEIAKMDTELVMLEQRRQVAIAKLNILLNKDPRQEIGKPDVKEDPTFKKGLDELYQLTEESRAELKAAKFSVEKGRHLYSLALQEYLPDFMVTYKQRDVDNHWDGSDIMFGFTVPIWFWEKQNFSVKEMKNELKVLDAEYKWLKNMVLFDVKEAHSRVEALGRLVELYKTSFLPQAEQTLKSSLIGYESNQTDFLNVLDSQRMLLEFKLDYYKNLIDYEIALADLERNVGVALR